MIFHETKLAGVFQIHLEPKCDERGFFARSWCHQEFESKGLNSKLVQCSISFNERKGTLRGIHYQAAPCLETKLVRCTRGAIYDVVVDLRPQSPTYKQWVGLTLTAQNRQMLYVAEECGHGFITLEDETEVFYQMSEFYHPELAKGVRWNDPAFGIIWPREAELMSERDRTYPNIA
jgi:dTDP-4-dehydrorhamnose 3,5-epimerase